MRSSTPDAFTKAALPEYGYAVCDRCNHLYPIAEQILDMAVYEKKLPLTLAGKSNDFFPTPQGYERIWRKRALSLLTGESFSVARELNLLNEWTDVQANEWVMDLGTSTGLYARSLSARGATIFAVDLAYAMLREAKQYIAREQRNGIILLRAPAEKLPFQDASMDAVVVGGSLNEMQTFIHPLREAFRVTKRGGRMFVMSLQNAPKPLGSAVQNMLRASGIQFPTANEFSAMAHDAGWNVSKQEPKGIVLFSLLTKGRA